MKYTIHKDYITREGFSISSKPYIVKEHNKTFNGVRYLTIQNIVGEFDTEKEAKNFVKKEREQNAV